MPVDHVSDTTVVKSFNILTLIKLSKFISASQCHERRKVSLQQAACYPAWDKNGGFILENLRGEDLLPCFRDWDNLLALNFFLFFKQSLSLA